MDFTIDFDAEILKACPKMRLGYLQATINSEESTNEQKNAAQALYNQLKQSMNAAAIKNLPNVDAARKAYKACGKDPSRYRPSAEALLRRLLSGKALYEINNVVDLINQISMFSGFSIGGYDCSAIEGQKIVMSVGTEGDDYQAIGRGSLNIEYLPCLRDQLGAFGSPTSDSVRTSIREHTQKCLWIFFDFEGNDLLDLSMDEASRLLSVHAAATDQHLQIIVPEATIV